MVRIPFYVWRLATTNSLIILPPDDARQPFHFSKSPSPAGFLAIGSLFPSASSPTLYPTSEAAPKTPTTLLSKNPNGSYKWHGARSARRNRYHSPAFGSPGSGPKIKLETAKSDSKRRRVGKDAETSSHRKPPQVANLPLNQPPVPLPFAIPTRPM